MSSSILNKDQKVLEKRKKTMEGKKASLRDQVVKKLYDKVIEDGIHRHVREAFNLETTRIADLLDRQKKYLADLDEHLPADAGGAFAGTSNLHLPMPFIVSKTYQARFMQAIWSVDPPFNVRARREDGVDREPILEDFMRYVVYQWANHNRGIEEEIEGWLKQWIDTGTGIMKVRWATEYCRYTDVEDTIVQGPPRVVPGPDGQPIPIANLSTVEKEVDKVLRKFNGPVLEVVQLEDFRMVGGKGDPDMADLVMHRSWMTASDLWGYVDQGMFDEDAVHEVIESGENPQSSALGKDIQQNRDENAGKGYTDTQTDLDRYEIVEAYLKCDVDGSGHNSDIVIWIHQPTGKLLRATYLYRIMPTGERPFSVIHFHKRPTEEYGCGLLETLHPLSVELDAMHNMRIDWGIQNNMPTGFYRANSSLDPETIQMEPGQLIPLDNPQTDIVFPQRPNATAFGAAEEQAIQSYVERLTGVSDLSLGVMTGAQGASRTASGVRALLGESNSNLDLHLRRLMRGWSKVLQMLYTQIGTRGEQEMIFKVTGQDGRTTFKKIERDYDMVGVDFELTANSANSNKAVQMETAQQLLQLTMNPMNIQVGLVGPAEIYNAQKNMLAAMGIKNPHMFIKKPADYSISLSPEEEMNRVIRGMPPPVAINSDHEGFMAFAQSIIKDQSKVQLLTDEQIIALITQVKQHESALNALRQQQAQAAAQQQMQMNAALAAQQAPVSQQSQQAGAPPGAQAGQLPLTQV